MRIRRLRWATTADAPSLPTECLGIRERGAAFAERTATKLRGLRGRLGILNSLPPSTSLSPVP
jgi:hypothetical protein